MKQQFKRVTAMGLGLVLTGGLVSACNPASDSETAASAQHAAAVAGSLCGLFADSPTRAADMPRGLAAWHGALLNAECLERALTAHVACFAPKLLVTVTVPSGERHYAAGIAASALPVTSALIAVSSNTASITRSQPSSCA